MKKLMIATAIATSIVGSAAHATVYGVSSDIPLGVELWSPGGVDALHPLCEVGLQHVAFGGFAYDNDNDFAIESANISFSGQLTYDYSCGSGWPLVRVTFTLTNGSYTAGGPNPGINFTDGAINFDVMSTSVWTSYQIIDAAVTNIPFLQGLPGILGGAQVTAGVVFPALTNPVAINNVPLPGLSAGGGTGNNGVSTLGPLFIASGLFLDGNIILTPW